jgi:hypothetical protein
MLPSKKLHKENALPFSIEILHQTIIEILERKDIGVIGKAFLLKNDKNLNKSLVHDYLALKGFDLIKYYYKQPELLIPSPKSASYWTYESEMQYYSIKIVERNYENMFGNQEIVLPTKAQNFLTLHTDEFLMNYPVSMKDENFQNFSEFASLYDSYLDQLEVKNYEARVDNLVQSFIRNVIREDFLVETQVSFNLCVNEDTTCEAIVDVAISNQFKKKIKAVLVVEDKTTKNVTKNLECQLIAEGIAAAQQDGWSHEWPVYMISSVGLALKFYKAVFSKEFINNVKMGYDCGFSTEISKLEIPILYFNLDKESGRKEAAIILNRIVAEVRKRR